MRSYIRQCHSTSSHYFQWGSNIWLIQRSFVTAGLYVWLGGCLRDIVRIHRGSSFSPVEETSCTLISHDDIFDLSLATFWIWNTLAWRRIDSESDVIGGGPAALCLIRTSVYGSDISEEEAQCVDYGCICLSCVSACISVCVYSCYGAIAPLYRSCPHGHGITETVARNALWGEWVQGLHA
jgi:hypothetical protein